MTLYRQLALSIFILFATAFIGTILTSTSNLRSFLEAQLETHAQDTATSLGLSLSPHMHEHDSAIMNLMIDAIFDRGYFQSIVLSDIEGNTLIERTRDIRTEHVPDWFISLVSFNTPAMEAIVMSGWKQAGSVQVVSHPGFAYRELWLNTKDTLLLFLTLFFIILLAALLTLKHLLDPLREIERQAEAICGKSWILQSKLPNTRELRSVVVAMNKLTTRVREIFSEQAGTTEKLRRQAYLDTLTDLPNRAAFNRQCELLIESSEHETTGALFMIKLSVLEVINDSEGYSEGDKLLLKFSNILKERLIGNDAGFIARLSGSEFGVILNGVDSQESESIGEELCRDFKEFQNEIFPGAGHFAYIGMSMWESGRRLSELLAETDHALRTASVGAAVGWHRYLSGTGQEPGAYGKEFLRCRIKEAIAAKNIVLYTQAVYSGDGAGDLIHNEILLRIPAVNGTYTATGIYRPMVDKTRIAIQLDRLVIEKVLGHIAHDHGNSIYAVNLSTASVTDKDFRAWLTGILQTTPRAADRVQLEMMENTVANNIEDARELINTLTNGGFRLGIDHFGKDFHPFGYLGTLKASYIKIDGYYTRDIFQNSDNQYFIAALRDAAHTLGIEVIAQSVETPEELQALRTISLDGYQGYVYGQPEPMML
ncbi:MAG TPA: LapD/MoxY N-terminal periplasmic domain-containing protein [Gammaproteobacteria bacterium]|nr:LapD/MoxY N-terminal periplasmic domain-containing protein [Gammaproteobacteria bacterium]